MDFGDSESMIHLIVVIKSKTREGEGIIKIIHFYHMWYQSVCVWCAESVFQLSFAKKRKGGDRQILIFSFISV